MLESPSLIVGTAGLAGAVWLGAGRTAVYGQPLGVPIEPGEGTVVPLALEPRERLTALHCFAGKQLPLWTFSDKSGCRWCASRSALVSKSTSGNSLPREGEHASIHWHGIRLPNDQDGVPYLVQDPVFPGEFYHYSFVPPDTGTFFFHTHCNTTEHFGRGLMGVLIVEGDTTEPYDADEVVLIRDWRVDAEAGRVSRRSRRHAVPRGPARMARSGASTA